MHPIVPQPVLQAIGWPGGSELLLILLIVLVVFGHNRIPQLGDALGKGIKNFRRAFSKDEVEAPPASREVTDERPEERRAQVDQKTGDANKVL